MEVRFETAKEDENQRIDKYLAQKMPEVSRSYLQKLLKERLVFVDGCAAKASYRLLGGERIHLELPESQEPDIAPEDLSLSILYEDDFLLVVDKPKGMVVHPCPGHYSGTLVNGVLFH
ncbi:MAG: S4 domain-containing protein, partial [Blautia sp.]